MLQKDYLMRMTQMLVAVLAKVLVNKEIRNFPEAEKELEAAAKTLVGLDLKLIKILSIEDLLKLMKSSDIYAGRCLVSAEILKEYADVKGEKGNDTESIDMYIKSLWLYLEAILTRELPDPAEYYPRTNFLIQNLSSTGFSNELKLRIFKFNEYSGQYSKAEDILFELIDSDEDGIKENAVSFYKRLREKSEEDLNSGNFSHEEVEESLVEINSIQ